INWTTISPEERQQPEELLIPDLVQERFKEKKEGNEATIKLQKQAIATFKMQRAQESEDPARIERVETHFGDVLAKMSDADKTAVNDVLAKASVGAPKKAEEEETRKWGMFAKVG